MVDLFGGRDRVALRVSSVFLPILISLTCLSCEKAPVSETEVVGRLTIFHAGSLAVPFKEISDAFEQAHPGVEVMCEAAGSRMCARKISDLKRACDVMASADYTVIDELLIPDHAQWNIRFAGNEMVIAYLDKSAQANLINEDNWHEVLAGRDVALGRSDPDSDPCGYRSVFVLQLAEKLYHKPGLAQKLLDLSQKNIRPKEVDLLALLEVGEIDYVMIYRSVAVQHHLKYVELPPEINLSSTEFAQQYQSAAVRLTGKRPGQFITKTARPIVYGVTIPVGAPNREAAEVFLEFLLDVQKGGCILEKNGQKFMVPQVTTTFERIPEKFRSYALPAVSDDEPIS